MGNCQPPTKYKITEEGWCQKFGKVQYVLDDKGGDFEGIRIVFDANIVEKVYQSWEKIVIQLANDQQISQFLILPVAYSWNKQDHLCHDTPTAHSYQIIYKKFFTSLSNELKLRIQKKACFEEYQVWYIGFILFKVSSFFQERGWYLSNIHPKNIIIDERGRVQIFTVFSSPVQRQNYDELKSSKYNDAYIAPEQTAYNEHQSNPIDKNKIDSYCIGLIMLSLICLKDLYFVFNHFDLSIKVHLIEQMLLKIKQKQKCSFTLYSIIRNLLEVDPFLRRSPIEYYQILRKHQNSILDMEQFQIDQIQRLTLFKNTKLSKKKKHIKEITFLTLSQKYMQEAKKTQIKVGQFIDQQMDTHKKSTKPFEQDYQE